MPEDTQDKRKKKPYVEMFLLTSIKRENYQSRTVKISSTKPKPEPTSNIVPNPLYAYNPSSKSETHPTHNTPDDYQPAELDDRHHGTECQSLRPNLTKDDDEHRIFHGKLDPQTQAKSGQIVVPRNPIHVDDEVPRISPCPKRRTSVTTADDRIRRASLGRNASGDDAPESRAAGTDRKMSVATGDNRARRISPGGNASGRDPGSPSHANTGANSLKISSRIRSPNATHTSTSVKVCPDSPLHYPPTPSCSSSPPHDYKPPSLKLSAVNGPFNSHSIHSQNNPNTVKLAHLPFLSPAKTANNQIRSNRPVGTTTVKHASPSAAESRPLKRPPAEKNGDSGPSSNPVKQRRGDEIGTSQMLIPIDYANFIASNRKPIGDRFMCMQCNYVGKRFEKHFINQHLAPKDKTCDQCSFVTSMEGDLRKHIRMKHGGECPQCCFRHENSLEFFRCK